MASHHQQRDGGLVALAGELLGMEPQAVRFDPEARAYEAFGLGRNTRLLDPLAASSLVEALSETTGRWNWDRGDRLGIREIGAKQDRLYVYAVRRKSVGNRVWRDFNSIIEHARWLEHICTIDLNVIGGLPVGLVGAEHDLHAHRQAQRPEGARR